MGRKKGNGKVLKTVVLEGIGFGELETNIADYQRQL